MHFESPTVWYGLKSTIKLINNYNTLWLLKEKDTNKELEVEEIVSKSEQFIENNSKKIIYGIIAVALVVGAVLGIKHGYLVPQEKKAAAAMFRGEQYFARDSFALALNGNGADYEGFEAIIDQYGSTDAGNLAKAYAGICYYKMGDTRRRSIY